MNATGPHNSRAMRIPADACDAGREARGEGHKCDSAGPVSRKIGAMLPSARSKNDLACPPALLCVCICMSSDVHTHTQTFFIARGGFWTFHKTIYILLTELIL